MKFVRLIVVLVLPLYLFAHTNDLEEQRRIVFPDVPGYFTLKCDLHQHTVFSDGSVWPTIRVSEALRDNLDAIAVTEHIEHQPHKDDIPHPDRNRAYHIELESAKDDSLIVINGSEITRKMPPGHSNAIFIQDANKLIIDDSLEVFKEANSQGAFVFWNHPNWTRQKEDGVAELTDMHRKLIKEGLLHGIEVVNDVTYSDEALQIALDNNLAIIGTSDIHGLIDWQYEVPAGGHRPVTLVFARERSEAGIKEGLEKRRTAVWFNNLLIGRREQVVPLIASCLSIDRARYQERSLILEVSIRNNSSAKFLLQNKSDFTYHRHADIITVEPQAVTTVEVKTRRTLEKAVLKFSVMNAVIAPSTHPDLELAVTVPTDSD